MSLDNDQKPIILSIKTASGQEQEIHLSADSVPSNLLPLLQKVQVVNQVGDKRRESLTRRPSYRKIYNELSSDNPTSTSQASATALNVAALTTAGNLLGGTTLKAYTTSGLGGMTMGGGGGSLPTVLLQTGGSGGLGGGTMIPAQTIHLTGAGGSQGLQALALTAAAAASQSGAPTSILQYTTGQGNETVLIPVNLASTLSAAGAQYTQHHQVSNSWLPPGAVALRVTDLNNSPHVFLATTTSAGGGMTISGSVSHAHHPGTDTTMTTAGTHHHHHHQQQQQQQLHQQQQQQQHSNTAAAAAALLNAAVGTSGSGGGGGATSVSSIGSPVGTDESCRKREMRLLKNREAARECRRKKKEYVKCLEHRVSVLESQNQQLVEELHKMKALYCKDWTSGTTTGLETTPATTVGGGVGASSSGRGQPLPVSAAGTTTGPPLESGNLPQLVAAPALLVGPQSDSVSTTSSRSSSISSAGEGVPIDNDEVMKDEEAGV